MQTVQEYKGLTLEILKEWRVKMHMAKKDVLKGRSIVGKNIFDQANQSIDEIKRANPIIDYFKSQGVELKSSGSNGEYIGLCPFHNDKNPSFR